MRRQTRKLSGPALERYLRQFFAREPGLALETAESLVRRARLTFSSVRVRREIREHRYSARTTPLPEPAAPAARTPPPPEAAGPQPTAASAFDPYAIALVPTFQREGRDGLIARLGTISRREDLRALARAQQIVLGEPLRQADVPLDALRAGIADAVAKRIADRRAAAG